MALLPMVGRELRVRARKAGTYWLRFFAAAGLLMVWTLLITADRNTAPARLGHNTFVAMTILVLGFCLLAGVFLTADCLSREKRDGTIGLLFLTPLKSYDVVLGKLAVSSVESVFAILAFFPVLALPLMMGGVGGAEFVRVFAVLLSTLAFSLGIGLFVSASVEDSRAALSRTFIMIAAISGVGPLLWWLQSFLWRVNTFDFLLWGSPGFSCVKALIPGFSARAGPVDFWRSLLIVLALGIAGALGACRNLHRSVKSDGALTVEQKPARERGVRARKLSDFENPFQWLVARQRSLASAWRKVFAFGAPCWVLCLLICIFQTRTSPGPIMLCMILLYGLHQVLKIFMAIEATRRFSDDIQSGALEILLVSPLSPKAMIQGHERAIRSAFRQPVLQLRLLNALFILAALCFPKALGFHEGEELVLFCGIVFTAALVLSFDLQAILCCGMWNALRLRRQNRAVLVTLMLVMGLPWFCVFLSFAGVGDHINGFSGITIMMASWLIGGALLDLAIAWWSKRQLALRLRQLVAK